MITAILSSKEINEEFLNKMISKKLDSVNNLQIALDRSGNTAVYPVDYPSSVNALLRGISIADRAVIIINEEITALDAELVLALENSGIKDGVAVRTDYSDTGSFSTFFSKYKAGNFRIVPPEEAFSDVKEEGQPVGFSYVSIDKHFIVKGIGSVIIGFNLGDTIKKGDRLRLLPSLKEVSVKSIQIMDVDSPSAEKGQHVGLALNNINEGDLSANYAISSLKDMKEEYACRLDMSELYKEDPTGEKALSCAVMGRNFSVSLSGKEDSMRIKFNRPIAQIKGKYPLMDGSLSVGKNRVVGGFELA